MPRPRIAALVTEFRENSHADVIVTKLLEGCRTDDLDYRPRVEVASLYLDQTPPEDIGRELAARHRVPIFRGISEALTLGGDSLAVDGVLIIGEHGRYPYNELGQHLYPRRRFFAEAAGVVEASGRPIPMFNDKHLSAGWADAKWIYDRARALGIPLMAGSSIPVARRLPQLQVPVGAPLADALAVGYSATEAYGFHALEGLQCMVERRRGGEVGVRKVQHLSGRAVWDAGDDDRWSWTLLRAALACSQRPEVAAADPAAIRARTEEPEAFLIEYRDGFRAAVLLLHVFVEEFLFAAQPMNSSRPVGTLFWLQEGKPFSHFARLCAAFEPLFLGQAPPYPVERTLLTTGILDRVMQSRHAGGRALETPELNIAYRP